MRVAILDTSVFEEGLVPASAVRQHVTHWLAFVSRLDVHYELRVIGKVAVEVHGLKIGVELDDLVIGSERVINPYKRHRNT